MHNRRYRRKYRAGTIYIVAIGTSLIVVCLAVASLQAVRVQRRMNAQHTEYANVEKLAHAGIEFVQHKMATDATWRTQFTNGTSVSRSVTGGTFSVVLTDPEDGNIANHSTDPIVITSTGIIGSATQKLTAYVEPQTQLYAASQSSLYSATELRFIGASISSNQWAYSADKIDAQSSSTVNMNCLAQTTLTGSLYNYRSSQGGVWPMPQPDMNPISTSYVGKYYLDNAVTINAADLPTGGDELVNNGTFETNTAGWTSWLCTLTRDTNQKYTGSASCLVSNRNAFFPSTPIQDITQHMVKGHDYDVSFWVRPAERQEFRPTIAIYSNGSLIPIYSIGDPIDARANRWTQVRQSMNITWSGALTKAELQISTTLKSNYHFDDVSIRDLSRVAGTRYIESVNLDRGVNPFGSGAVSANGIYSINAPGAKILIRNCRLGCTIAVQGATKVEVSGAVNWIPSGRNFPALIANAPVDDLTTGTALLESVVGRSLNPTSSPSEGSSDADASDSYANVINGAILSVGTSAAILMNGGTTLSGPIMSTGRITVTTPGQTINFQSDMITNPPPSFFADPPKMRLIPSSIRSVP
jgi:Carbohydrate binding domain